MNEYLMLVLNDSDPGLRIIEPAAYVGMITDTPHLQHENCGNFFSEYSVSELPAAVAEALEVAGLSNIVTVEAALFQQEEVDSGVDYLITDATGVRVYSPSFHTAKHFSAQTRYGLLGLFAAAPLFTDAAMGSLQHNYKRLEDVLRDDKETPEQMKNQEEPFDESLKAKKPKRLGSKDYSDLI